MVESNDQSVCARVVAERVVFAVEVVHQRVDHGEVEQVQVEATLVVRLDRPSHLVAVRPIVEPVLRPPATHLQLGWLLVVTSGPD